MLHNFVYFIEISHIWDGQCDWDGHGWYTFVHELLVEVVTSGFWIANEIDKTPEIVKLGIITGLHYFGTTLTFLKT